MQTNVSLKFHICVLIFVSDQQVSWYRSPLLVACSFSRFQ